MLSARERLLAVFRRENTGPLVYQPRLYYWYYCNSLPNRVPDGWTDNGLLEALQATASPYAGNVPSELRDKSMIEVYRALGVSPRYSGEVLGVPLFKMIVDPARVTTRTWTKDGVLYAEHETRRGRIREAVRAGYHLEFLLKEPRDFAVYRDILDATTFLFDPHAWQIAEREFAQDGIPQTFFPRSPFQRCILELIGFESTIYALADYPEEMQELFDAIEEWDDSMYENLCASPMPIVNFGENIDANLDSPAVFEQYLLPYYARRTAQFRAAGKFTHIHADGSLGGILPMLVEAGFDAIEAATPAPQGDLTIEEIKEIMGDTILLDGIPAVAFLPSFSIEEFESMVSRVVELFSPNLILGISDELPPGGEIERVRLAAQIGTQARL